MSEPLDRQAIIGLFEVLSDRLAARGARADLFLVGGAAMAVAYDERGATRDLDAVFVSTQVVSDAATDVADQAGLPDDWLNDAVEGFLPGDNPDGRTFFESPSLRVDVASPSYLLAVK